MLRNWNLRRREASWRMWLVIAVIGAFNTLIGVVLHTDDGPNYLFVISSAALAAIGLVRARLAYGRSSDL